MPRNRTLDRFSTAAGLAIAALVLAGCSGGGAEDASGDELATVSFRTDIYFNGGHLPLIAGIEEGIYAKHGLDVEAEAGSGSGTTVQLVGTGSQDMGFADGSVLVQSVAQGIEAKMIAGIYQTNPTVVALQQGSGLSTLSDLEGTTGGFATGSAMELLFPALASKAGLDVDSVEVRSMDIPTRDSLFAKGDFDFAFAYVNTTLPVIESNCDCEFDVVGYADEGVSPLSNGFIVGNSFAEQNPETVKAFAAATQEAIQFVIDNPEKALDHFFTFATETQLSRAVVEKQWTATEKLLSTPASSSMELGCMAESDWLHTIELLQQYGGVPAGKVSPADLYDNSYLGNCKEGS